MSTLVKEQIDTTTLANDLNEVKARLTELEWIVRRIARNGQEKRVEDVNLPENPTNAQIIAWLKAKGLVVEPSEEDKTHAAEWANLPEEEKQKHIEFMRSLKLDPPLSQIIIDNRHSTSRCHRL